MEEKDKNEQPGQEVVVRKNISREHSCLGFILDDGTIGELCYDPQTKEGQFAIASPGKSIQLLPEYIGEDGTLYLPLKGKLIGGDILFPSKPTKYLESTKSIFQDVKEYIHRYVDLPEDFEDIASIYVLLTWVYDALQSLPYIRLRGNLSTGKSRFLKVAGAICFRSINCSGATSASAVFRLIDTYRGTLVMDEADWRFSGEWAEVIKILNNGYEPGTPVYKSAKQSDGRWDPECYHVFGPKILATKERFKDDALESRMITQVTEPTLREEIPPNLPDIQKEEALALRNRLLVFRLQNWHKVKENAQQQDTIPHTVIPRTRQILTSMAAVAGTDQNLLNMVLEYVNKFDEEVMWNRQETTEFAVLQAIIDLKLNDDELSMFNIADKVYGSTIASSWGPRSVGRVVREKLGLHTDRATTGISGIRTNRIVAIWDDPKIEALCKYYGILPHARDVYDVYTVSSRTGDPVKV